MIIALVLIKELVHMNIIVGPWDINIPLKNQSFKLEVWLSG